MNCGLEWGHSRDCEQVRQTVNALISTAEEETLFSTRPRRLSLYWRQLSHGVNKVCGEVGQHRAVHHSVTINRQLARLFHAVVSANFLRFLAGAADLAGSTNNPMTFNLVSQSEPQIKSFSRKRTLDKKPLSCCFAGLVFSLFTRPSVSLCKLRRYQVGEATATAQTPLLAVSPSDK